MKLGGLLGTSVIRAWMSTLDYKAVYYDPTVDPASPQCDGRYIYIFWHEYIPFPLYIRQHCNISMLLSRHQDAEMLSHAARMMGFGFVRGSTNRGGVKALRELLAAGQHMHLTMTPDGPRGPRRQLAPGAVFLASKLQMPLILVGFGYDRPWRFRHAWDQFAVPRPGSRARLVFSSPIHVPRKLGRETLEHYREKIEILLTRLTLEAEAWAATGTHKCGQIKTGRRSVGRRKAA